MERLFPLDTPREIREIIFDTFNQLIKEDSNMLLGDSILTIKKLTSVDCFYRLYINNEISLDPIIRALADNNKTTHAMVGKLFKAEKFNKPLVDTCVRNAFFDIIHLFTSAPDGADDQNLKALQRNIYRELRDGESKSKGNLFKYSYDKDGETPLHLIIASVDNSKDANKIDRLAQIYNRMTKTHHFDPQQINKNKITAQTYVNNIRDQAVRDNFKIITGGALFLNMLQ